MTQLRDVVYVVCVAVGSSVIRRYNATTHRRLGDIVVTGLRLASDIAACELTSRLCVADWTGCVWRVSSDGVDIQRWLPKSPSDRFKPIALSVTSSRLLVTSYNDSQLRQFDAAGGGELRRVGLRDYMLPEHAVESPTGTFVVGHFDAQLHQYQVSEVSTEGHVLRQFSGPLGRSRHIAVDRHGNIFAADSRRRRILLLDAQLALRRVVLDERQLSDERPSHLCYTDESGRLLVALKDGSVAVFRTLRFILPTFVY